MTTAQRIAFEEAAGELAQQVTISLVDQAREYAQAVLSTIPDTVLIDWFKGQITDPGRPRSDTGSVVRDADPPPPTERQQRARARRIVTGSAATNAHRTDA